MERMGDGALGHPDELKIEKEVRDSVAILSLAGAVSVNTYEKLEAALNDLFDEGKYRIIIDMAGVRYVASAGAGVLMNALSQCRENHGNLVLANLSAHVLEIFDLLNLTHILPIADSLEAALNTV